MNRAMQNLSLRDPPSSSQSVSIGRSQRQQNEGGGGGGGREGRRHRAGGRRGGGGGGGGDSKKQHNNHLQRQQGRRVKNTLSWEPLDRPVDMRVLFDQGKEFSTLDGITSRDVVVAPNLFADFAPGEIHDRLLSEVENAETKMWHGNQELEGTHLIVNDRKPWKESAPTFHMVTERIQKFFKMNVQATRFNIYTDTEQWKPFHHDAAAVKPEKANVQNFTVAVSFGATREAAFEHAKSRAVVSFPHGDGCAYCFSKDTNIIWRHGILQELPKREASRISIIAWGGVDMMDVKDNDDVKGGRKKAQADVERARPGASTP